MTIPGEMVNQIPQPTDPAHTMGDVASATDCVEASDGDSDSCGMLGECIIMK